MDSWAPEDGAMECRLTWRSRNACQRTSLTDGWKLLEQGPCQVLYQYGVDRDFHIEGDRLFWHGGFDLETTDRVVLRYPKTTPTS